MLFFSKSSNYVNAKIAIGNSMTTIELSNNSGKIRNQPTSKASLPRVQALAISASHDAATDPVEKCIAAERLCRSSAPGEPPEQPAAVCHSDDRVEPAVGRPANQRAKR